MICTRQTSEGVKIFRIPGAVTQSLSLFGCNIIVHMSLVHFCFITIMGKKQVKDGDKKAKVLHHKVFIPTSLE